MVSAIRNAWTQQRSLLGEFAFELVVVIVGVTAAFVLENWRESAAQAK